MLAGVCLAMAPSQQQTFRSGTDQILIDAQVVARKDGAPIAGLKPEQFEVAIDGRKRPIVGFEFVRAGEQPATAPKAAGPAPGGDAAPSPFTGGRVFVVAIDQSSFPMAATSAAREALRRVIDTASPEDYLGLVAFPGKVSIAPTRDHQKLRNAADGLQGLRFEIRTRYNVSATEAGLIKLGDPTTVRDVQIRECGTPASMDCPARLKMDAIQVVTDLQRQGFESVSGLHSVMDAMETLPGRKTLLVVSAGIPMSERPGVEPNMGLETSRLAEHAAFANVNLYVFYMNVHFLRAFSAEFGRMNNTLFQDISVFRFGLEKFSAGAGGSLFQIEVNSDPFVARVMRETSAYYLLTVASEPRERDGKEHAIRVSVKTRDADVRHRTVVTIPKG